MLKNHVIERSAISGRDIHSC